MFDLFGKTIVITGASSGIGRECAILCSRMGASLILFGRNKEQLKNTLSKLEGENHFIFNNDIREIEKIDLSIGQVVRELGPIDGLIHSAGIQYTLPLRMHNKSIYYDQLDVNTIGGFEVCRIITKMNYFNSEGGSLVLIASIRGIQKLRKSDRLCCE